METFYLKEGDLWPSLEANLKQANNEPIPLQEADEITFVMTSKNRRVATKVQATASIINHNTGHVKYDWVAGDTDTAGQYQGEFLVMLNGTTPIRVPNNGYFNIIIDNKLGTEEAS